MPAKLFFYDLETTGLNPEKNGIHQLSYCIEAPGKEPQFTNLNVRPFPEDVIETKALEVARVSPAMIMENPAPDAIYKVLITELAAHVDKFDKTDKFFLVGYNNAAFDNPFFRQFFLKNGDKYFGSWFWSNSIDVMVLAAEYLKDKRAEMPNFKLSTVAEYLGVDVDAGALHNALYDIELTRQVYKIITSS